jgi:hypothetical protein
MNGLRRVGFNVTPETVMALRSASNNLLTEYAFSTREDDEKGILRVYVISEALHTEGAIEQTVINSTFHYFDPYSEVEGLKWELAISPNGIKALGRMLPEVAYALKDSDDITIIEKAIPDWSPHTMRLALYGTRVDA